MKYRVKHITNVKYTDIVRLARFNLRLKPIDWPGQELLKYALSVKPTPTTVTTQEGPYVVNISRLTISEPLVELTVTSSFDVHVSGAAVGVNDPAPTVEATRHAALNVLDISKTAPAVYLFSSRLTPMEDEIAQWAEPIISASRSVIAATFELAQSIKSQFAYDPDATKSDTLAIDAFRNRHGVCQDFAHIMITALRSQGIPAAYVSGYLRTLPPPGRARLIGADATHAWVNVWCGPELRWVGFDPTNACIAGSDHIFTAMGRDYGDVAPVDGVFLGGRGQHLKVSVDVEPLSFD